MAKVSQRNKDYWRKRMEDMEDEQYRQGAAYYKDVQEQFRKASNSIQMDIERWYQRLADNNDISYAGAKRLLKKNELEEFQWSVEQYIKAGEENAVDQRWMKELENASARHHISYLEAMKLQTQQHAELLSTEFEGGVTDYLHKAYGEQYHRTAYEIAKGTGVGTNLAQLDNRSIDAVIRKSWARDGANFSDRIWINKEKLVNNLHTELTQSVIRGESPQKVIISLAKTMDVSRAQAGRLIMTESAAISSAATKDSYKELGVEQYEILATLDSLTSRVCRELDGKVFDMRDYKVGETAPPFHPNCRTTTVPYFDDESTVDEQRAARNEDTGKTYYVSSDMKYPEWEKRFINKEVKLKSPHGEKFERYIVSDDIKGHRRDTPDKMVSLVNEYTSDDFVTIDEKAEDAYAYNPDTDMVVVNPKHELYGNYNPAQVMIHEVSHRIDRDVFGSPMNTEFSTVLINMSDRLLENRDYYQSMFAPGGKMEYNAFISDIVSSVTHNEIIGVAYHDLEYIQQFGNKELEVFADTFTVLYNGDDGSVEFLKNELSELYQIFLKMVG